MVRPTGEYGVVIRFTHSTCLKRIHVTIVKRILRSIDYRIFRNFGDLSYRKIIALRAHRILALDKYLNRNEIFSHKRDSVLNLLSDKYGSDKGTRGKITQIQRWPSHTYTDIYTFLFDHSKNSVKLVLECGIGSNDEKVTSNMTSSGVPGASLRMWRDYFQHAEIVGIDIDVKALFDEDRITTYQVDQTDSASINSFIDRSKISEIDLVIDDGLHEFHAAKSLFENIFPLTRSGGIYVIEDVLLAQLAVYKRYFDGLGLDISYILLHRHKLINDDNFLIIIRKI